MIVFKKCSHTICRKLCIFPVRGLSGNAGNIPNPLCLLCLSQMSHCALSPLHITLCQRQPSHCALSASNVTLRSVSINRHILEACRSFSRSWVSIPASSASASLRFCLPSAWIESTSSIVEISISFVCLRVSISTIPRSDSLAASTVACLSASAFFFPWPPCWHARRRWR